MKILLYGINFAPELTGTGKYMGEMAAWLAARGHDVRVVTAPPYYPAWAVGASAGQFAGDAAPDRLAARCGVGGRARAVLRARHAGRGAPGRGQGAAAHTRL